MILGRSALRRSMVLVLAGGVIVGIGNYGYSLVLVWILATRTFAVVASVNSLLVVVGTMVSATTPWLVARQVVLYPPGSRGRQDAVSFALLTSLAIGVPATAIVLAVASSYAGPAVLVALAITTLGLFIGSTGIGFLEGTGRFGAVAVLGIIEVGLKVGLGATAALAGFGAAGAVAGAALGAVLLAVVGMWVIRAEVRWPRRRVESTLWHQMTGIGGIQIGVSVLTTLDVIVGSLADGSSRAFAGYQAMLVFARAPLFVSSAMSIVVFPRLASAQQDRSPVIRQTTILYFVIAVYVAAVVATAPKQFLDLVLPHGYGAYSTLLLPLSLVGFGAGAVNLLTTYLQADGRFRPVLLAIGLSVGGLALVEIWQAAPVAHLAWAAAAGDLAVAAVLLLITARRFPASRLFRPAVYAVFALAGCVPALWVAKANISVWLSLVALGGLLVIEVYRLGRLKDFRLPHHR